MSGISIYERNIQQGFSDERVIHISYSNFIPGNYEKQVIFGNKCPSLTGMRCIFEGSNADVFYIIGGLCRFEEYVEKKAVSTQDLLGLILSVLKAVKECSAYLVMGNEISLKSENIYFTAAEGRVQLMYMPGGRRLSNMGDEIILLTEKAERISRLGLLQKDIIKDFCSAVSTCGDDVADMIAAAEEAMRKTYIPFQDVSDENEIRSQKLQEEKREYMEGSAIKKHIRDFFNELVS